ncbi:exonuclease SbcCD subunit D [bacterium 1xD42-62]|uniref:Nuclease SbcCD subunit D n=2 Tax=Parablautia muri TaxID=2320879 RepID=A0A9X5GSP5_9FIRM|nr:exonuclease SbcCD subunit D [Parablautia muri]
MEVRMKFLHIADLHIGKIVNDFSMLEDQRFILEQMMGMAKANQADAVVIAGDIYDRSIPPGEAVVLFDSFLTELSNAGIRVIMISGNHDSPERISFGESLLGKQGVHIAGTLKDIPVKVRVKEKDCETEFVLLPFVKPAQVGARTSQEAVERLLVRYWQEENLEIEKNRVLVTHFFVTDAGWEPELSDSESTIHVGGLDNVDASVFQGFDYVALGHIHKPQQIGTHPIWYAGSPLKYSFGECEQVKAALLVTLDGKGQREVKQLPLRPLREMRKIKGTLKKLLEAGLKADGGQQDYIQALLTDKGELIDPIGTLRSVYPNVMQIVREDIHLSGNGTEQSGQNRMLAKKRDALALFEAFYKTVREDTLSEDGRELVVDVIKELEG